MSKKSTEAISLENLEKSKRPLYSTKLEILPFHHLISASLLVPAFEPSVEQREAYRSRESHPLRRQLFWQSLATRGISAKEAALLDDSVEYQSIKFVDNRLVQIDWSVLHYDELADCAEIYLAEMLIIKRRIYETGGNLRHILELIDVNLSRYLPQSIFGQITSVKAEKLFFDSLSATYNLTISSSSFDESGGISQAKSSVKKKRKPVTSLSDYFDSHRTEAATRVKSWSSRESITNGEEERLFALQLTDYWQSWRRAALISGFDFDYLETVGDARAVRFYELTKLWRVSIDHQAADLLPNKMEIEYSDFCSLMPIPGMTDTERAIKRQIGELIKPLKKNGYIKSFTLKPDWRNNSIGSTRLSFRFNE